MDKVKLAEDVLSNKKKFNRVLIIIAILAITVVVVFCTGFIFDGINININKSLSTVQDNGEK